MTDDAVTRQFFSGFVRLHVLAHAAKDPICAAEMAKELVRHGYRVSRATLTRALRALVRRGYLSRAKALGGRRRDCYRATAAGRAALAEARQRLLRLRAEFLEGRGRLLS
jgi:DNA-binding MarR family transcriptional regulator